MKLSTLVVSSSQGRVIMILAPVLKELSIESLTETIYSNLGADRAIIDGAAGNKIGAYLSVTYYKNGSLYIEANYSNDEC